jgi:hypothetical protein
VGWKSISALYKGLFSEDGDVKMQHENTKIKMLAKGKVACLTCDQHISGTYQGKAFLVEGVRVTWVLEEQDHCWRIVHAHWSLPSVPAANVEDEPVMTSGERADRATRTQLRMLQSCLELFHLDMADTK